MNFLADPEYWRQVRDNFGEAGRGAVRGLATQLPGAAVDLVNMAYIPTANALGYNVNPADTVGSSAWFANQGDQRGLLPQGDSIPFRAGEMFGPMAAAAAPDSLNMLASGAGKVGNALGQMSAPQGPIKNQLGIIGYHGSPHKFDKFDMSKIGTGEGAQAYGHGLYFAENPNIAMGYREALSANNPAASVTQYHDGAELPPLSKSWQEQDPTSFAARALQSVPTGLSNDDKAGLVIKAARRAFPDAPLDFEDLVDDAARQAIANAVETRKGNLYHVDIPDEHIDKMLDWDKPLSEQPDEVRKAFATAMQDAGVESYMTDGMRVYLGVGAEDGLRGRDVYQKLVNDSRDSAIIGGRNAETTLPAIQASASEYLRALGIPGIKYLDAGSRGAGNGTRNFVLFDDQIPKIIKRE